MKNIFRALKKRQLKDIDYNRWLLISSILMVVGLLMALLIAPEVTQCVVKYMFTLMRGSYLRNQQRKVPYEFNVYVWNTTNPDEVIAGGKPKLQEVGPYKCRGFKTKQNMADNDYDDTVSYDIYNEITFDEADSSPLTGNETFYNPHPFIMGIMAKIATEMPEMIHFIKKGVDMVFQNPTSPFIKLTAKEIIRDSFFVDCNVTDFSAKVLCSALANQDQIDKVDGNPQILASSLLYQMTARKQGNYKVLRGLENVHDVGRIVEFNGLAELETYDDDECNVINGTDEMFFGPFMEWEDPVVSFDFQLCRSFNYNYDRDTKVKGHKTTRKILQSFEPKNPKCFCNKYFPEKCLPKGAFDINQCWEAPVAASFPHFLDGPEYLEMFDGFSPNREKHYNGYDFDLLTGVPIRSIRRFQMNFRVIPIPEFPPMSKMNVTPLYPNGWIEQILYTTSSEDKVIKRIHFWDIFLRVIGWLIFSFGILGAAISTLAILARRVPITPEPKMQRQNTESELPHSAESETPDSISTVEREDNEFELYNRVNLSRAENEVETTSNHDTAAATKEEEEEDEGIDGR
ncbi:sensory neuron membrane protein 1-like [Culicoides brevitarsis]|uniref:sensory neuron membrane protein 1-like n=1 Tax=Culicoides brevitarsis TaxID=469753 RepID=UPI00307C0D76